LGCLFVRAKDDRDVGKVRRIAAFSPVNGGIVLWCRAVL